MNQALLKLAITVSLVISVTVSAQEIVVPGLRQNIDIFSGVLEDALDIAQSKGLFGISIGGIDSTYLYGQGVVMEVRTPLANRRNRMSLSFLSASVQSLPARENPFAAALRQSVPDLQDSLRSTLNTSQAVAADFYADMMDRVAAVDYSIAINSAIRQASEAARSMRAMNTMDEAAYAEIRAEMTALQEQLQEQTELLRQAAEEVPPVSSQSDDVAAADVMSKMQARLEEFTLMIEPLKQRAIARATELKARSEEAEKEYIASWEADVVAFEAKLYAAMCDYGSMLRELPAQESVTIILTGLGEDAEDGSHTDKIHVFNKADLVQCQSGELDLAGLRQRSAQYSY